MSRGARILTYLVVLTLGLVLGLASVFGHILLGGWLMRLGLIPNACAQGCGEGWILGRIGPFVVTIAAGVGLFDSVQRRVWVGLVPLAIAYAGALRWGNFTVQYAIVALFFATLAWWAGRTARRFVGD